MQLTASIGLVHVNSPEERRRRLAAARLYAISNDADPSRLLELVPALLRGGVDVVQLRHKTLARGDLHRLACSMAPLVAAAGALFIVNDHADIAILSGADGVHLGPDDLPVEAARRIGGPELLIGASAATVADAQAAEAAGADYLGSGPAFRTPIKPGKDVIGPARIASIQAACGVPVFAIGGIDNANLGQVLAAGVTRICMIRALFDSNDPAAAARTAAQALRG